MALDIYTLDSKISIQLPFVGGLKAGFPSLAQDYIEASIDLIIELIKHPSITFIAQLVEGVMLKLQ